MTILRKTHLEYLTLPALETFGLTAPASVYTQLFFLAETLGLDTVDHHFISATYQQLTAIRL
jgi:hypothetical protein